MKIKVSNYIAKKLVEAGISQVFTVTGGGAMHLNDALGHQEGLTCLYQHHEQACAISAESYARIHNKIGALCVTTGPGGTNAITGVVGGWLDSIPMLVLSGQVRYDTTARWSNTGIRAMGDQEFDIVKSIDCMTKYSEMVIDPSRIRYCLEKAIYLAYVGRPGPTWLDIPLDVQGAYVDPEELEGFDPTTYESKEVLPEKVTEEVAKTIIEKIRQAQRPVFYTGNGIRIANAHCEFMQVAEKLGIPVVVGWNGPDCIWTDHPLYVGRPGNLGDRPGNFAVQNSDLVFSVGSRLSIRQVGYNYKTWAREAYVIVNDIDIEELKKPSVHIDMPVHADAKDLLTVMLDVLEKEETPIFKGGLGLSNQSWLETCTFWKTTYPVVLPKHMELNPEKPTNVYALVQELSSRGVENQITVVGNGSACVVGGNAYIVKKGQRFISNSAIASMGYDLPAAIGACVARNEDEKEDIILLTGDGSIQMNLQELQTIIHHKMPIKIFIINNEGYHSIRQTQKNFFGEPLVGVGVDSCDLSFPDMEKLAAAYGYPYVAVRHNGQLVDAIEKTLVHDGPMICEVFVSCEQNFEPKSSAKRLPDGTLVSPPLEDLSPFLPEEEMERIMVIKR